MEKFLIEQELGYRPFSFIGGCMFLCRSNVLRPIQNLQLKLTDFEEATAGGYTLAHVMERMFGFYTIFLGYKCDNYVIPKWEKTLFINFEEKVMFHFYYLKFKLKQKLKEKKS